MSRVTPLKVPLRSKLTLRLAEDRKKFSAPRLSLGQRDVKKIERTFWLERCYDEKNWVYLFQVTTGGRQNQNHIGPPGGQNPGYAPDYQEVQ